MIPHRVAVEAKPVWHSKELWTNVIGFLILVLTFVIEPANEFNLPEDWNSYIRLAIFALQSALTIFFRVVSTDRPVALGSGKTRYVKAGRE